MGIKLLSDYVLIQQDDQVQEEKRESGIILFNSDFNLYQFGDDNQRVEDIIAHKKQNKGTVMGFGGDCEFVQEGDKIIYKKQSETGDKIDEAIVVCERYVLAKELDGRLIAHPNYTLIKITKESRDAVFSKKIKRDDGTEVDLFMAVPLDNDLEEAKKYFVSIGEIVSVGKNVQGVEVGDLGLLSHLCDNDDSIIVGYEGEDKIIAVQSITIRHKEDHIVYAGRRSDRDQMVWAKDDYDVESRLIGVIRGEELISIDPYVFLAHESNILAKTTRSGIEYFETHFSLEREVIAASESTENKFNVKLGDKVLVHDLDIFEVTFSGKKVSVINDDDILGKIPSDALKVV